MYCKPSHWYEFIIFGHGSESMVYAEIFLWLVVSVSGIFPQ